jgi:hypothetical protein
MIYAAEKDVKEWAVCGFVSVSVGADIEWQASVVCVGRADKLVDVRV